MAISLFSSSTKKTNPYDPFGLNLFSSNGKTNQSSALMSSANQSVNANQSRAVAQSTNQPKQPIKQPQQIQGSGYSSAYASNPTNYKAPTPQPEIPPQQQYRKPSSLDTLVSTQRDIAGNRISGINTRLGEAQGLTADLATTRAKTLADIAGMNSDAFDKYAGNVRSGIGIQEGAANRQIGQVEQDYADEFVQNEQARKERMRGLESTLAGLNTLESSAFGNLGASINMGAERMDRQAQRTKNDRIATIQDNLEIARNNAETLIQQEGAKYLQELRKLQGSLDENSIEFKQSVLALQSQADENINKILGDLSALEYNAQTQAIEGEEANLSELFLTTGQPQTRADYIYSLKNPEDVNKRFSNQSGQASQQVVSVIDQLLNRNVGAITGIDGFRGNIPGTDAAYTKGLYDQLSSLLTLENVSRLKGTGAISDREFAVLQNAASALNRNLKDEDFIQVLRQLRNNLAGASQQTPANIDVLASQF